VSSVDPPRRVAVLGLGLLGGSFCHAVRALPNAPVIVGYAHNPHTLASARELGLAHHHFADIAHAVADADLVVLATPIGAFEGLLRQMAAHLKPGVLVTDVGSTKRTVCRLAREILPRQASFVGSHPMAGGERSGASFARADLFHNVPVILTPEPGTPEAAVATVDWLWKALGAWTTHLSPESHDRLMASISHTPHVTAAMLVALQTPASLDLAGGGYRDSTRIAASNPDLWRDILLDNRDNMIDALRRLRAETDEVLSFLESNDGDALREYLASAAIKRGAPIKERPWMV
jgi:prephenate dehydrogenase